MTPTDKINLAFGIAAVAALLSAVSLFAVIDKMSPHKAWDFLFGITKRIEALEVSDAIKTTAIDTHAVNIQTLFDWTEKAKKSSDAFVDRANENVDLTNDNFRRHREAINAHAERLASVEKLLDEWDRREVATMPMPGCQDDGVATFTVDTARGHVTRGKVLEWANDPATVPDTAARDKAINQWIEQWGRSPIEYIDSDDFGWIKQGWARNSQGRWAIPGPIYDLLAGKTFDDTPRRSYKTPKNAMNDLRQALMIAHKRGIPFPDCA